MRRAAKVAAGVVVIGAVLVGGLVLGAEPLLNSEAVRGRVVAALERATGHAVRFGRVELAWGSLVALSPVVGVRDVAVLNGAGFSREALGSARLLEVKLALLPLLAGRVEVGSVTLVGPDVLLERDAAGRGNWERPVVPGASGGEAGGRRGPGAVEVGFVRVVNGVVAWRGAPALEVPILSYSGSGGGLDGRLVVNGVELVVAGTAKAGGGPFSATATGGGVVLGVSGGGDDGVAFRATAGALEAASALVGRSLPALRDVVVTGRAGPGGLTGLHLEAGESALGVPGLGVPGLGGLGVKLLQLKMDAVDLVKPVQVAAVGAINALPVAVVGSFGPLGQAGEAARVPVAVQLSVDGGMVGMQGVVDVAARTGEGVVSARLPDLGRTGGLAGVALPALRDLMVDARVAPGPGGTVLVRGLRVGSAQGDLAGDLAVGWSPRPSVRGSLVSSRLVLDVPVSGGAPLSGGAAVPGSGVAGPAAAETGPVLSDEALPFGRLKAGDGDVRLSVGQVVYRGATYRAVEVWGLLQDGKLRVDPLRMTGAGGVLDAQVSADAGAVPPTVAVTMRTPGMDAGAFMEGVTGMVEMDVALRAAGASLHALAGSVTGHVALALVDGEIENAELSRVFGGVMRGANVPLDAAGRSRVRCLAVRMEAEAGQARVTTLALDSTRLRVEGEGTVDFGAETMDMHLRPVIRIGGTGVAVPVRVSGPWRSPKGSADRGVLSPGRFGISIGVPAGDPCGPALAAVRAP